MKRTLEVCIDSLASARAAVAGGADRLEVCSALAIGGLTPFCELVQQIRQESNVEIRCMIRPREGDFLYTGEEIRLMVMQIETLRKAGADGFVFGCLDRDGYPDRLAMNPLLKAAEGKKVTLHRAIDVSRDLPETYRQAADMGFSTVLTSGGASCCSAGKETIGKLLNLRRELNGPEVLIGAGVSARVIREFRDEFPDAVSFHMSGKEAVESQMKFRKADVPMGLPGLDEWHWGRTSEQKVREARIQLDL